MGEPIPNPKFGYAQATSIFMNKTKRCQNCSEEIDDAEEGNLLCEDCAEEAEIGDEVLSEDDEE